MTVTYLAAALWALVSVGPLVQGAAHVPLLNCNEEKEQGGEKGNGYRGKE